MLTWEEKNNRIHSLWAIERVLLNKWCDDTPRKLEAFLTWFEPPETFAKHLRQRIDTLREEGDRAYELYKQVERAEKVLRVRPSLYIYDDAGKKYFHISTGWLPNGQDTSANETIALKQLKDFYEEKANEDVQNLRQGTEPF